MRYCARSPACRGSATDRRQVARNAVREMLPIRIVAEIDEGQDDNRQTRDAGELQAKGGRFAVRRQFTIFAHLSNKSHALSLHSTNNALLGPAVVDGSSRGIEACRQSRIRDDPPVPNAVEQLVLADDPVAV